MLTGPNERGLMSVADFKKWASIGHTTFYEEVKAGRLRIRKLGSKTLIAYSDALAWLENLPTNGESGK